MKITLRFTDDKSDKFWMVEVEGAAHTVRYGKVGSSGQSKTKEFASEAAAVKDAEAQAAKKRKKGYEDSDEQLAGDDGAKAAPKNASAKNASAKKAAPKKAAPKKAAPKKKAAKKAKPPSERTLKGFFKAIREENRERVEKELERGLDPSVRFDVSGQQEQWPALYYACYQRANEMAALLIERGADVTATVGGANALLYVKDAGLAQALVDAGADPNAAAQGVTPLHTTDDVDVARVLLDAGAEVDGEDGYGRTPFETTTSVRLRDLLLERGAKGLRTKEGKAVDVLSEASSLEHANPDRGAMGFGPDGALWLGGYAGLFRVEGATVTRFELPNRPAIDAILACHDMLYIVTNQGLFRFDGDGWRQFQTNDSELHDNHIVDAAVVDDELWCVGYESEEDHKHVSVVGRDGWRLLRPGVDIPKSRVAHVWRDARGTLCIADGLGRGGGYFAGEGSDWTKHDFAEGTFSPKVYAVAVHDGRDYVATHMGLFTRGAGDSEWAMTYKATFKSMVFIGDDLFGTTGYEGMHVRRGDEWIQIESDKAGVNLNNLTQVVPHPEGGALCSAGSHLYRVDADLRFRELNEAMHAPTPQAAFEPAALPDKPVCDPSRLPSAWVKLAAAAELAGLPQGALVGLADPAIGVLLSDDAPEVGGSKRGGLPDLPDDLSWPLHPDDEDSLPFILQLNLEEMAEYDVGSRLPKTGRIYVFCDTSSEGEEAVVLYSDAGEVSPRAIPEDLGDRGGSDFIATFSEKALSFQTQFTLPSHEWMRYHGMGDDAEAAFDALKDALCADTVETQVLGWPDPVQGEFLAGAESVALLQLGAMDDEFGRFIVDGLRYWIIDRAELKSADFSQVWTEYQYT